MNVWLLIDNKKDGPHHDYEVRSMINNKDVEPDVMAWHEGMGPWKPLGEIPLFAESFTDDVEILEDEDESDPLRDTTDYQPEFSEPITSANVKERLETIAKQEHHSTYLPPRKYTAEGEPVTTLHDGDLGVFLWRRFFARCLDFFLLSNILVLTAIFTHRDAVAFLTEPRNVVLIFTFFVFHDIFCVHLFGTSLGKASLGIRIESATGPNVGMLRTFLRSIVVVLLIALFINPILVPIFVILCIFFEKRRGRLPWDIYGNSVARALKLSKNHIIGAGMLFILIMIIPSLIVPVSVLEQIQDDLKSRLEQQMQKK